MSEIERIIRKKVELGDPDYFCDRSWTVSYNMNTNSWDSFHTYIPNWYIGENNFFYSGINDCCGGFDFDFIAGTVIPNPSTTTTSTTTIYTTTTTTSSTSSTSTTTTTSTSTSSTTTTSTTTVYVCHRPVGLDLFLLITGYEIISPSYTFVSTGSLEEACSAINVILAEDPSNILVSHINAQTASISLGETVYLVNGTTDCTYVPDGWYFTDDMAFDHQAFHVVSGMIVAIDECVSATTTTTSTSTSTSTTTTTTTLPPIYCGEEISYNGESSLYPITQVVDIDAFTGTCYFDYNSVSVPDRFIVRWNGSVVIDIGYVGSSIYDFGGANRAAFKASLLGKIDPITTNAYPDLATYPDDGYPRVTSPSSGISSFDKSAASPANAYVDVYSPMIGSNWTITLHCPGATTTTTTSSTSTTTTSTSTSTTSTTSTTTTKPPVYQYIISNPVFSTKTLACVDAKDVPSTNVYSDQPIGSLIGEQLYLDSSLTIPYSGINGHHWILVYPYTPGDTEYWATTSSGVVTDSNSC